MSIGPIIDFTPDDLIGVACTERKPRETWAGSVVRKKPVITFRENIMDPVTLNFGQLQILAPKASGNACEISASGSNIDVVLNGQTTSFEATLVGTVLYEGGASGGDTFTSSVALPTRIVTKAANNNVTGAPFLTWGYFNGTGNTYTTQGGTDTNNVVFQQGGIPVTINNPGGAGLQVYNN